MPRSTRCARCGGPGSPFNDKAWNTHHAPGELRPVLLPGLMVHLDCAALAEEEEAVAPAVEQARAQVVRAQMALEEADLDEEVGPRVERALRSALDRLDELDKRLDERAEQDERGSE